MKISESGKVIDVKAVQLRKFRSPRIACRFGGRVILVNWELKANWAPLELVPKLNRAVLNEKSILVNPELPKVADPTRPLRAIGGNTTLLIPVPSLPNLSKALLPILVMLAVVSKVTLVTFLQSLKVYSPISWTELPKETDTRAKFCEKVTSVKLPIR